MQAQVSLLASEAFWRFDKNQPRYLFVKSYTAYSIFKRNLKVKSIKNAQQASQDNWLGLLTTWSKRCMEWITNCNYSVKEKIYAKYLWPWPTYSEWCTLIKKISDWIMQLCSAGSSMLFSWCLLAIQSAHDSSIMFAVQCLLNLETYALQVELEICCE